MLLTGLATIERNDARFPAHYRLVDRGAAGWEGAITIVASTVEALLPFCPEERLTLPLDGARSFRFVVERILAPSTLQVRGKVELAADVRVVVVPARDRRAG